MPRTGARHAGTAPYARSRRAGGASPSRPAPMPAAARRNPPRCARPAGLTGPRTGTRPVPTEARSFGLHLEHTFGSYRGGLTQTIDDLQRPAVASVASKGATSRLWTRVESAGAGGERAPRAREEVRWAIRSFT